MYMFDKEPKERVKSRGGEIGTEYFDEPDEVAESTHHGKLDSLSKTSHTSGSGLLTHGMKGRLTGVNSTAVLIATAVLGLLLLAVVVIIIGMKILPY